MILTDLRELHLQMLAGEAGYDGDHSLMELTSRVAQHFAKAEQNARMLMGYGELDDNQALIEAGLNILFGNSARRSLAEASLVEALRRQNREAGRAPDYEPQN